MSSGTQQETIAFLSNPKSYDPTVQSVDKHETHGSIVFLAGERAYKLKRAVKFPYMDYSTVAQRKQMCMRELEINRNTAPMLYLEAIPIVRDLMGSLHFGTEADSGVTLDWVVVMQRFDQNALLEQMRVARQLTRPLMRRLAETIGEFHHKAEITPTFGGAAGIRAVIEENVAILKSKAGQPFDVQLVHQYETEAPRLLASVESQLDERQQTGHVRRCHGDLHLNNICLIEGNPVLFDAIEFGDTFSCIDVLYDLAFLLMDLDQHGLRDHANSVLNRYLEQTDEHSGLAALPLFLSCRAAIRAHTALAASEAANDENARGLQRQQAVQQLERAVVYLTKTSPRLVAIGGVSGTGKTTLARDLAPSLGLSPGAVIIRSDIIRKQLMGVSETSRLPESAYTPAITARVYGRMTELAARTLRAGYSVIVDAVFGKESERLELAELAKHTGVPFDGLWLEAPGGLLANRIGARVGDASDATVDVLCAQLEFVSPPSDWSHLCAVPSEREILNEARRLLGC